ncbi:MAG TPA: hypothetical protein DCM18_03115, partial [Ruminococcus sp.]|nr:hypothetical protein [Ruminococcus sp.]
STGADSGQTLAATDTLVKICSTLGCTFDDTMEIVPDEKRNVRFIG